MNKSHVATFLCGVVAASTVLAFANNKPRKFDRLDVFAQVLSYVEANYVDRVDPNELIWGATHGLVDTLDPYSAFLSPDEFSDLRDTTDGQFGGVGIEIDFDDGVMVLTRVLPGSPALRAGLKVGDRIVAVDGHKTRGQPPVESAGRLRGKPGTTVTITVARAGFASPKSMAVTREIVKVPAVQSRLLDQGIAYARIAQFQEGTVRELAEHLAALAQQNGHALLGIVLDLRDNPGGLFDQGVKVADLFVRQGVLVSSIGRGGQKLDKELAHAEGAYETLPVCVLVNDQTASAAEIVAGALKDHRRAKLVGTKTFGKGSVQSMVQFDDGSGLKLTIARYLTPSGQSIQDKGIVPDILVPLPKPGRAATKVADDLQLARAHQEIVEIAKTLRD